MSHSTYTKWFSGEAPKHTRHLEKFVKSRTVLKRTNLSFAFVLKDKQIVEMIDAKVLKALKGFSGGQWRCRIQTFTLFLRGELGPGAELQPSLPVSCTGLRLWVQC